MDANQKPLPTKTVWGTPLTLDDAPFYAAKVAAMHARLNIHDEIDELKRQQRALGPKLRAAARAEKKADKAFAATPSAIADERALRHYMAEKYGPHHLLPEEREAFLATHPQFVQPATVAAVEKVFA